MAQALLIANRHRGTVAEAEPITINTDDDPNIVVLHMADGERIELDAAEARGALLAAHKEAA